MFGSKNYGHFSFCAIYRICGNVFKNVCVVLLWFKKKKKDGMYITKNIFKHISWKINILKNKE